MKEFLQTFRLFIIYHLPITIGSNLSFSIIGPTSIKIGGSYNSPYQSPSYYSYIQTTTINRSISLMELKSIIETKTRSVINQTTSVNDVIVRTVSSPTLVSSFNKTHYFFCFKKKFPNFVPRASCLFDIGKAANIKKARSPGNEVEISPDFFNEQQVLHYCIFKVDLLYFFQQ